MVIVLSGPEPQRTILFDLLLPQARAAGRKVLFVCGLTEAGCGTDDRTDQVTCVPHMPTGVLFETLLSAGVILCRPGYSTLMDLAAIGRTAILIPTPGQTEQEYLARRVSEHYGFVCCGQDDFSLGKALRAYRDKSPKRLLPFPSGETGLLAGAIRQLRKEDKHHGHKAQEKA